MLFGVGLSAVAQPPDFSLPPLPGIPEVPSQRSVESPSSTPVSQAPRAPEPAAAPTPENRQPISSQPGKKLVEVEPIPGLPPVPNEAADRPAVSDGGGDGRTSPGRKEALVAAAETAGVGGNNAAGGATASAGKGGNAATAGVSAGAGTASATGNTASTNAATADTALPPPLSSATEDLPSLDLGAPLPMLPAPTGGGGGQKGKPMIPSVTPLPVASAPKVEERKVTVKTWETTLAPSITPPKLGYRYRHVVLPRAIYRDRYDVENQHLPTAVTQTDYAQLFLMSAARNDIDATRALLNDGVPIGTTNSNGETALELARRYHAEDTARLLIARGAR